MYFQTDSFAALLPCASADNDFVRGRLETTWINSRPGMIISKFVNEKYWRLETIMSIEIEGQRIVRIFAQRNPEKLEVINRSVLIYLRLNQFPMFK